MPQLIGMALVGGLLWYGYRTFKREMERVGKETREAEARAREKTVLKQGEDGVYRPSDPES